GGGGRQQPVALLARALLQACPRLAAAPAQGAVGDAERARQPPDRARFGGGGRTQAVIDGDGDELRPALQAAAPARRQQQQRGRVGTAGDCENESGGASERTEQRLRLGGGDRSVSSGHAFVLARPPVSRSPMRAGICAAPRRATRRPPLSRPAGRATARGEAAHPAPWRWIRIWSRR